jgi:short-subunit dehydrogenase
MNKTAVITGASAGIGGRFARLLAGKGYDLVLVARDENRLTATAMELEKEFGIKCEVLVADLSTEHGCKSVEDRVSDQERPIDSEYEKVFSKVRWKPSNNSWTF